MQLSNYIVTYPSREKPGYLLVYSTKKASLTLLTEEMYRSIEKGTLSASDEAALAKLGIVVPDREAEKRQMLGYIDGMNARNSRLNVTAVLNLDCNFACAYCFEGEMKGKLYMTRETAQSLVEFIRERFSGVKSSITVSFYGGEPLLSLDLIVSVSESLKAFAEGKGASYTFNMVTNGSLFKREIAERLVPLGLTGAKITLDGPPEVHNRCRPFKSGAGSFDVLMKNIRDTCDLVKIHIGGNYQKDNYREFPRLLDLLEKEGLTPERIPVARFDAVMGRPDRGGPVPDFVDACLSVDEPWLVEAGLFLREAVLKKGYGTPRLKPSPCMMAVKDSYVVNFDGALYKCPALIGIKELEVGSLQEGMRNEECSPDAWKNDTCLACAYLPLCFGGCRYMAHLRGGRADEVNCKKANLDATLETVLQQDIRYRRS